MGSDTTECSDKRNKKCYNCKFSIYNGCLLLCNNDKTPFYGVAVFAPFGCNHFERKEKGEN